SFFSWGRLFAGNGSGFAGIDANGPVFFGEVGIGDALDIGGGDSLEFGAAFVDFLPIAITVILDQLHQDGEIGSKPPVFAGCEIVFHLLQFFGRDLLLLEPVDVFIDLLFDLLGGVAFVDFAAGVEVAGPFLGSLAGVDLRGDTAFQDQFLVEAPGAGG